MANESITFDGFTVQYGKTKVQELLDKGYSISALEQIVEEPALASCDLNKDNEVVAILSFWNIKEMISQEQLYDVPIDLVLLENTKRKNPKTKLAPQKTFRKRIIWTVLIHSIAAAIFFCVYAIPPLFYWVQNTEFRLAGGAAPIGAVLLILPALVITFIWSGGVIGEKGVCKKIALSFWLILNVIISLVYLILIDNLFTDRFF